MDIEFAGGCIVPSSVITISNIGIPPNAGTSTTLTLCTNDPSQDLFGLLGGADIGGTWSPAMNSGTGVFDPGIDPAGIYTYTVSNGCPVPQMQMLILH